MINRITQLKQELKLAQEKSQKRFDDAPPGMNFEEYEEYFNETDNDIGRLSRNLRLIMEPTFTELPDFGDVMPLEDFIENVNMGGFIDYDGWGSYVRDGKKSDITINPSDVKHNSIRTDFDTIIWYNR